MRIVDIRFDMAAGKGSMSSKEPFCPHIGFKNMASSGLRLRKIWQHRVVDLHCLCRVSITF